MNQRVFQLDQFGKDAQYVVSSEKPRLTKESVVHLIPAPSQGYLIFQRVADVVLSVIFLSIALVPAIVIALLIKLESPGSILFRQRRVGRDGRTFWFYKFRSMVVNAEQLRARLTTLNDASGPLFKMKADPRITRVGRFIRKTSLDELPQLVNVLLGDMSLVGPRPALPAEVRQYDERQCARLAALPGITGLWQVSGRSDLPFDRSVELDLEFVSSQSCLMYIRVLIMTIPAVLLGKGAY